MVGQKHVHCSYSHSLTHSKCSFTFSFPWESMGSCQRKNQFYYHDELQMYVCNNVNRLRYPIERNLLINIKNEYNRCSIRFERKVLDHVKFEANCSIFLNVKLMKTISLLSTKLIIQTNEMWIDWRRKKILQRQRRRDRDRRCLIV